MINFPRFGWGIAWGLCRIHLLNHQPTPTILRKCNTYPLRFPAKNAVTNEQSQDTRPLRRRNVYIRSDNHHGKLKYVCVKTNILVTEIPEDAPNCGQHTRRCHTHHANSAQNDQLLPPTYGEIIYALWDGRSGEACLYHRIFNSPYHIDSSIVQRLP